MSSSSRNRSSQPLVAKFSSDKLCIGAGVAIFHLATSRVILCYHSKERYWFLPKGRRDVHEHTEHGAEREGFEESGYRNRLLPLPMRHRQPQPRIPIDARAGALVTEPVWTQLVPQSPTAQYMLFWYVAETVPPGVEAELNEREAAAGAAGAAAPYLCPPRYPVGLRLRDRIALEEGGYEPVKHEGTAADEDEALYVSFLLAVPEAMERLRGSLQRDVVARGWEAIQARMKMEEDV